jgi:hypothetical protein
MAKPTTAVLDLVVCVAVAVCFVTRRTLRGTRTLRMWRTRHMKPHPGWGGQSTADPNTIGVGVALHGNAAVLTYFPNRAVDLGLLDGGRWNRRLDIPTASRSQGSQYLGY